MISGDNVVVLQIWLPLGGYIGSGDNTQSSLCGTCSDCFMCLLVKIVKLGCERFQKSTDNRLKKCGWQGLMSSLIWPMQILIFLIIVTVDETWRFLYDPKHTSVLWMENKNISTGKVTILLDKSKGEFWDSFWIRNVWFTMSLFQRVKLCVEILWPLRDVRTRGWNSLNSWSKNFISHRYNVLTFIYFISITFCLII